MSILLRLLDPGFPSTPVLRDFNEADHTPDSEFSLNPSGDYLTTGAQVLSGVLTPVSADAWIYFNRDQYGPDAEAYVTEPTQIGTLELWIVASPIGVAGQLDGYLAVRSASNTYKIYRTDNGTKTQLGADVTVSHSDGDSFGLRRIGSDIQFWHRVGAGPWSLTATRTDSTYIQQGRILLYLSAGVTVDNLGGGTLNPVRYPRTVATGYGSYRSRIARTYAVRHPALIVRGLRALNAGIPDPVRPKIITRDTAFSRSRILAARQRRGVTLPTNVPAEVPTRRHPIVGRSVASRLVRSAHRTPPIILRAPVPEVIAPPGYIRPTVLVSASETRAAQVRTFFARRSLIISRAPSTPTETPLVRQYVTTTNNSSRRSLQVRAYVQHRETVRILRAPAATPEVGYFRPKIIVSGGSNAPRVRAYFPRRKLHICRAPVIAPITYFRPKIIVSGGSSTSRVRAYFARRQQPISRPLGTISTFVRPKITTPKSGRRAASITAFSRHREQPRIVRAPRTVAPSFFRPKVVTGDTTRSRNVRAYFQHRERPQIIRSTRIGAPAPFFRPKIVQAGDSRRSRTVRCFVNHREFPFIGRPAYQTSVAFIPGVATVIGSSRDLAIVGGGNLPLVQVVATADARSKASGSSGGLVKVDGSSEPLTKVT